MHKVITNTHSGIILIDGGVVTKEFNTRAIIEGCYHRELKWLKRMREFDRVPMIMLAGPSFIRMAYMGEEISAENIPDDWEQQATKILNGLRMYGCAHNDIKPRDILVKEKIINLIDFGWATNLGAPIPSHWPKGLGLSFKVGVHNFDDKHSLIKSIKTVLGEM